MIYRFIDKTNCFKRMSTVLIVLGSIQWHWTYSWHLL